MPYLNNFSSPDFLVERNITWPGYASNSHAIPIDFPVPLTSYISIA
jgi:hypothetical protein